MSLHRLQHSKYAKNMQKICIKYAQYATKICNKYAINMQNMHKSMYLHILHKYALPTVPHFADGSTDRESRGPERCCPHRAGGALPLAGRGLGPRHRGPPGSRTWCATAALRRSGRWRRPRFSTGPRTARPGVGCSSGVCVSRASLSPDARYGRSAGRDSAASGAAQTNQCC